MHKYIFNIAVLFCFAKHAQSQTNPIINNWLQNTTTTGYYYMAGNSTPLPNNILVNCQEISYSTNWAYIKTRGMPAYKVGPYLDGNPNQAGDQNAIFKYPLNPTQNTGTPTATTGGNIGVFINGVAMFDFRDGVAWNTATNALCGGPGNPPCSPATTAWYRDAVLAERPGFDCSKGHPAGTNYHHHQNPSAFKFDLTVLSQICNLYDSDGLYVINTSLHSPLLGFAYDGFPVYGAYGYANADGSGGITRIKSGYQLRNITLRTHYADGTDVPDGPPVSTTYPLGYFREDYEWISHPNDESYLDVHNGRFCITPEYPNGIYCYFATVNTSHNSAYPYMVGPTYYGNKTAAKVSSITESVTVYPPCNTVVSSSSNSGAGSLRNVLGCLNSGGTITFSAGVNTTLTDSLFINVNSVIQGNTGSTVINMNYSSGKGIVIPDGISVTLKNIKLNMPISQGPLIYNKGTLILDNVEIKGNATILQELLNQTYGKVYVYNTNTIKK